MMGAEMRRIKEGYKETEIGVLPEGWEVKNLGILSTLIDGDRGKNYPSPNEIVEDGILFLSTSNIQDNNLTLSTTKFITKEKFNKLGKGKILQKDLVITLRGTLGSVMIFETEEYETAFINAQMMIIRPNEIVHYKYLYQTMISKVIKEQISKTSSGSAQPQLTKKDIINLIIPLPSFLEQQRIAGILSATDAHIEKLDDIIKDTQLLKKGMMRSLFTEGIGHTEFKNTEIGRIPKAWEVSKINDIADYVGSGVTPRGGASVYKCKGITFIRSQNVYPNKLVLDDVVFIDDEINKKMKRTMLQELDILLNITGASIGRSAVLPIGFGKSNVNQHVCIIRLNKSSDPYFLCQFLNSIFARKQIDSYNGGSSREGLNFKQVRNIMLPLPSLTEQQEIAEILSAIDDRIQLYEKEKEDFTNLKKGLMEQFLTGEIRVL